ncbi:hypothetical protein Dda_0319 [Drechslerella dactyloides]|uniref:RAVE subunit 2/Rogdi n=1 Tax=Drechslerella dactyloides TaxID=74499 RepID=A0AAD6J7Q1_DREDA|nr:hypothetical protein Dda_0319 [Drechslerella dactyloides]
MRIEVYPHVAPDVLDREIQQAAARELAWVISEIMEGLLSLRPGLEECLSLLAPSQPGSTLVLSTSRSEGLKGFVTRVGSAIVKTDMQVKMHGLPHTKGLGYYRLQLAATADTTVTTPSLPLPQLTDCRNFVHSALTLLPSDDSILAAKGLPFADRTATALADSKVLAHKLDAILSDIRAARAILKSTPTANLFPIHAAEAALFDPPLPETLAVDVTIQDVAIVTELRLLEAAVPAGNTYAGFTAAIDSHLPSFNLRERFAGAFKRGGHHGGGGGGGGNRENGGVVYRGVEVKVKERIRVESQDPSLMSVMAKLGALEHNLAMGQTSLGIVMRSG